MDINRINSNDNFGAKIAGELAKEIEMKKADCETSGTCSHLKPTLDKAIKEITRLMPNVTVDIYEKNPNSYKFSKDNYDNPLIIDRFDDKNSYDYKNLIYTLHLIATRGFNDLNNN